MAGGINEALYYRINRKLEDHPLMKITSRSIFKVPNHLRRINEKAYEPQVISIGPYHHGKVHLQAMEVQKMNSLRELLRREEEGNKLERFVTALVAMEKEARNFYSEPLDHIGREEFVEMMLLDGCFIIELIFYSTTENLFTPSILRKVMRDLLLVENQIPFFVLSKLHSLSRGLQLDDRENAIAYAARLFLFTIVPGLPIIERGRYQDAKHLLGLVHFLSYSSEEEERPREVTPTHSLDLSEERPLDLSDAHSLDLSEERPQELNPMQSVYLSEKRPHDLSYSSEEEERRHGLIPMHTIDLSAAKVIFPRPSNLTKWQFIGSATELNEAGVEFQKNEGDLFDIKFQNGVLSIPTLKIDDNTESILRNLVAYEQCYTAISSKRFTDYITFMDCLINTGKDVELLCRCGVLDNWLGDHEVVATMFNRLRDSVFISETNFFYSKIFNRVNEHCNRKWNLWKANLRRNYFNTPWASISFIAAVILLLSALLQAVFSILSYHH